MIQLKGDLRTNCGSGDRDVRDTRLFDQLSGYQSKHGIYIQYKYNVTHKFSTNIALVSAV